MILLTWLTAQAAGLGLESDISPNQTGSVDDYVGPNADAVAPYRVPPHAANEAFLEGMETVLVMTIGMNLSSITTSENFPWTAIQIRHYFAQSFCEQFEAPAKPIVSKFLLPPEQRVSPEIVPAGFRYRLGSLELLAPNPACALVRNLDWLSRAVNMNKTLRNWRSCRRFTPLCRNR